jgi:hypothetical protein
MIEMTITVCHEQEAEDILEALSNAEEEGVLNFPFQVTTRRMNEDAVRAWKKKTLENIGIRLRK